MLALALLSSSAPSLDLDDLGAAERPSEPATPSLHARRDAPTREVVLATPLSVEGEATALYVADALRDTGTRFSRLASGLPHGGELEYADPITLGRAFDHRRPL